MLVQCGEEKIAKLGQMTTISLGFLLVIPIVTWDLWLISDR